LLRVGVMTRSPTNLAATLKPIKFRLAIECRRAIGPRLAFAMSTAEAPDGERLIRANTSWSLGFSDALMPAPKRQRPVRTRRKSRLFSEEGFAEICPNGD
jgi:hypothetical protein